MQSRKIKFSKTITSPEIVGQKIKVGFDFDGVLYYNPTRILRPFSSFLWKMLGVKKTHFYIPKNPLLQKIGAVLHKTSFTKNRGFAHFVELSKNPLYELYVITARPSFVKENLTELFKKHNVTTIKQIFQNIKDEQPHLFKERLIKELKLDYFIEDNWGIVEHLLKTTKTRVIWIYNLVDRWFIHHLDRAPNLGEAVKRIIGEK